MLTSYNSDHASKKRQINCLFDELPAGLQSLEMCSLKSFYCLAYFSGCVHFTMLKKKVLIIA
jgi:hypothetical protein